MSFYTKIPHADGVAACRTILNKHNIQSDIATDIPILIDFIHKHNTAHAIIFMESDEIYFLSSFPHKPTAYYGYIHDIFMR